MGIRDSVQGEFASLPPFTAALETGVRDEIAVALQPIVAELNEIKSQLAAFGINIQSAIDAANSAASAAAAAQSTANTAQETANNPPTLPPVTVIVPPVTVTVTPPITETIPSTGEGEPVQPTPEPTPTPPVTSETPRVADQLVLALADPFLLDQPVATITGGGTYAIGDSVTLRATNIRSGYTFNGWYNSTGQQVSISLEYPFTVQSGGDSFTARFVTATVEPPAPATTEATDGRVNVTIKWNGVTTGARTQNGEFIRRMRIGTNPGNVTQVDTDVTFSSNGSPGPYPVSITTRVLPGTQVVLNTFGGSNAPSWRIEGSSQTLREAFEFRPTVPSQDTTYIAVFTR